MDTVLTSGATLRALVRAVEQRAAALSLRGTETSRAEAVALLEVVAVAKADLEAAKTG